MVLEYIQNIARKNKLSKYKNNGYAFQIEMTVLAINNGVKIIEIPISVERESESQNEFQNNNRGFKIFFLYRFKK